MGYIIQTEGEYSVLKVGNIADLQTKNIKIIVKKFKEKEKISASKKRKNPFEKDSFSAFKVGSSAGTTAANSSRNSALFETLRQLRLQIAKEESVPPYIVLILGEFLAHVDKGFVGEDDVGRDGFFFGNLEAELA